MPAWPYRSLQSSLALERGFVIEGGGGLAAPAGRCGRSPRVDRRESATATAGVAAAGGTEAPAPASAAGTRHLLHLRRGVPQGGADLVDLQLVHGALLALAGLVGPLAQPALHDHPRAALQRLRDVLGRLTPDL